MRTSTPALDKARTFLEAAIEANKAHNEPRLPRIADMARQAGVAPQTMWKAVRERVDRGILETRFRGGTCIVGLGDAAGRADSGAGSRGTPALYVQTADRIEADLAGDDRTPVPSAEELASRHGVCAHTVRKALATLVQRGVLMRERRRFAVRPSPTSRDAGKRVILIMAGDTNGDPLPIAPSTFDNYRYMDAECAVRGLQLERHTLAPRGGYAAERSFLVKLSQAARSRDILGCVIWPQKLEQQTDVLIDRLLSWGLPVALYHDDRPDWRQATHRSNPRLKLFRRVDDVTAGSDVAEALLAAGHREVVFISPFHNMPWSRQRLAGLENRFRQAALPGRVNVCTAAFSLSPRYDDHHEIRIRNAIKALLPDDTARTAVEAAEKMMKLPLEHLQAIIPRTEHHEALRPLLNQAQRCTEATAWVGASDTTALSAMDFLARAGRTPGDHIAVIGFDDSFEGCVHRLSSYGFNHRALCRMQLRYLQSPHATEFARQAIISAKGILSHRATTSFDLRVH